MCACGNEITGRDIITSPASHGDTLAFKENYSQRHDVTSGWWHHVKDVIHGNLEISKIMPLCLEHVITLLHILSCGHCINFTDDIPVFFTISSVCFTKYAILIQILVILILYIAICCSLDASSYWLYWPMLFLLDVCLYGLLSILCN